MDSTTPLANLLVLDFSQFLSGPSCTLRLADMGARVVKVENAATGDSARSLALAEQWRGSDSVLFHTINRNKQSYAANLKDEADRARVLKLIERADVLVHNFRPTVMERLGLGWDVVSGLNRRLIYAGVSGFGDRGEWRDRPGQDLLVQALTGMTWLSGNGEGPPVPMGLSVIDMAAGAQLVQGILAALVRRGTTGRGGRVDVSMLETALDLQFEPFTAFLNGAAAPSRSSIAGASVYLGAPYGLYAANDGYLALAMMPCDVLAEAIGSPRLAAYPRESWFAERDAIKMVIADHLAGDTAQHWLERLQAAGLWCAPVLDWPALMTTDSFAAVDPVQRFETQGGPVATTRCPIRFDGARRDAPTPAPCLGVDNAAIDTEFGLNTEPRA